MFSLARVCVRSAWGTHARTHTFTHTLVLSHTHPHALAGDGGSYEENVEVQHTKTPAASMISQGCWLQHTATHCNILQHTVMHCNTDDIMRKLSAAHCTTLQHTATHCNALQHTATHCTTLQQTTTHCITLHHTATHCKNVASLPWALR